MKCSILNWQSKTIKRVFSSLAADTLALSDAIDDGIYISELISELEFNIQILIFETYSN